VVVDREREDYPVILKVEGEFPSFGRLGRQTEDEGDILGYRGDSRKLFGAEKAMVLARRARTQIRSAPQFRFSGAVRQTNRVVGTSSTSARRISLRCIRNERLRHLELAKK